MTKCPVCDYPETDDIRVLLERIGDPALCVELAVEAAESVSHLTDNPSRTRKLLACARAWRKDPASIIESRDRFTSPLEHNSTRDKALWACSAALQVAYVAASGSNGGNRNWVFAAGALEWAAKAQGVEEKDLARLVRLPESVKQSVCTCPALPEGDLTHQRGRTSLLAG